MIWATHKIIFHHFAFKNFSLYIIHAFRNIRLWVAEKCSTLTITAQQPVHELQAAWHLFTAFSPRFAFVARDIRRRSSAVCVLQNVGHTEAFVQWVWNSTENWVNELSYGMKDNTRGSVRNTLHCLLRSEAQTVWPSDCARALLSPELQRKCMKTSWCFNALAVKKYQMKAAIWPKRGVWCGEAFQ